MKSANLKRKLKGFQKLRNNKVQDFCHNTEEEEARKMIRKDE